MMKGIPAEPTGSVSWSHNLENMLRWLDLIQFNSIQLRIDEMKLNVVTPLTQHSKFKAD